MNYLDNINFLSTCIAAKTSHFSLTLDCELGSVKAWSPRITVSSMFHHYNLSNSPFTGWRLGRKQLTQTWERRITEYCVVLSLSKPLLYLVSDQLFRWSFFPRIIVYIPVNIPNLFSSKQNHVASPHEEPWLFFVSVHDPDTSQGSNIQHFHFRLIFRIFPTKN